MEVSSLTTRLRLRYLIGPGTELPFAAGQVIKGSGTHQQYCIELDEDENTIIVDNTCKGPAGYLWELLQDLTSHIEQDHTYEKEEKLWISGLDQIIILYNDINDAMDGKFLVQLCSIETERTYTKSDPKLYEEFEGYGTF